MHSHRPSALPLLIAKHAANVEAIRDSVRAIKTQKNVVGLHVIAQMRAEIGGLLSDMLRAA